VKIAEFLLRALEANGVRHIFGNPGTTEIPLLVLIGGQDRRFLHTNPILWGPLEKMAGTVCKAVFGLNTRYDTAANVRRALRTALTPPYSPVALVCPPDLLEQEINAQPAAVTAPRCQEQYAARTETRSGGEAGYRIAAFLVAESLCGGYECPLYAGLTNPGGRVSSKERLRVIPACQRASPGARPRQS
jgi:thiamine pyrophosphate-dependent acetolactate synthase large subunit-like protein